MLTHRSALRRRTQNPQETTCSAAPRNPTDAVTPRRKGRSGGALGCGDAAPEAAEGIDLCHANVARLGQNAPLQACRSLATSPHRDSIAVRLGSLRCAQRGARKLHDSRSTDVTGRSTTRSRKAGWSVSFSQQCVIFLRLRRVMIPACLICRRHLWYL